MNDAVVVDASVAIKWLVDEPLSDLAEGLRDRPILVPTLFYSECANVLWLKWRTEQLTAASVERLFSTLLDNPLTTIGDDTLAAVALDLARTLDHPVYDCVYLALAMGKDIPFITADQRFFDVVSRRSMLAEYIRTLASLA